nr:hypothetical protein [uncultured Methanobrevibacter sp.]
MEESEDVVVEEICGYIENKSQCIPNEELGNVVTGMYLNIVEYVDPKRQDEMLEKIDMESKTEGVIEALINEGKTQGFGEGRKSIIEMLLENHSMVEVANLLEISLNELKEIIKS